MTQFEYRNGELHAEDVPLSRIAEAVGTPVYVYSETGLTDAYRVIHKEPHKYSFWDYQRGAWQKDFGVRIDHLLLSPQAVDRLKGADIDRGPRGKEKASDHTPVYVELSEA